MNIYDQRPEPDYGTGAIVNFAKVSPMPKAGGKWNMYEITAKGSQLIVVLNGVQTANINHSQFPDGPFSLQFGNLEKGAPAGPSNGARYKSNRYDRLTPRSLVYGI